MKIIPQAAQRFFWILLYIAQNLKVHFSQTESDRVLRMFYWKGTSSYTKVEFGNVVLAPAQYFIRKIDELHSLSSVIDFIGNVLPHDLHKAKVTWSFNLLQKHYGKNEEECTEHAQLFLRRLMKLGLAFIDAYCDQPIANGTDCYWVKIGVQSKRNGSLFWQSPKCTRALKRCRIDEFFIEHRKEFEQIKKAIDDLPEDQKSQQLSIFSEVIEAALADPRMLLDYQVGCRRLADAIIAIDSIGYRSMFGQNEKESTILTDVLNQFFYYLPPNPDKGILVRTPSDRVASKDI